MEPNKNSRKKDEVKSFEEMFRKMSFKEKFIEYLSLTFTTIGVVNLNYISTQIINNKDILLSEMLWLTMASPFIALMFLILFVYFFEPITKRLREHS